MHGDVRAESPADCQLKIEKGDQDDQERQEQRHTLWNIAQVSNDLRDVSKTENTYCKAEDYYSHLEKLKEGEIYVSRVVGAYAKGWLYKSPEGTKVKLESAYAGKENPYGQRFDGIIRWATPVYNEQGKIGYLLGPTKNKPPLGVVI